MGQASYRISRRKSEVSERINSLLFTVNSLHSVSISLTEFARELLVKPDATLTDPEVALDLLAEALATIVGCLPADKLTDVHEQLLTVLLRFHKANNT